jgi:hypothetical protein
MCSLVFDDNAKDVILESEMTRGVEYTISHINFLITKDANDKSSTSARQSKKEPMEAI